MLTIYLPMYSHRDTDSKSGIDSSSARHGSDLIGINMHVHVHILRYPIFIACMYQVCIHVCAGVYVFGYAVVLSLE